MGDQEQACHVLGRVSQISGKRSEASRESKDALATENRRPDMRHQKFSLVQGGLDLANRLEEQGKVHEAEAQYRRTLMICAKLLGEDTAGFHESEFALEDLRLAARCSVRLVRAM